VAFWFSPFAWWLERKLVELAEVASDDEAVRGVQDRVSYAEVLVTLAKAASKPGFAGLAMARGRTVERRVERILHESAVVPAASWMCRALVMAAFLPLAAVFGGAWLLRVQPAAAMAIPQQETLPPRIHQQASNFAPPEERRSTVHPVAAAQTPASTISGTVFDLTGAVIPGVTVALLNADGVAQGKALSNDSGAYSFGQIAAGQYTIEATIPTFATFRKAITLAESTAVRQDVILQLGRTETRLEVSASKSEPAPAPPDPTAGTAGPRVPLRIGGDVLAPTLISAVNPVYPSRPRINHVEGSVVLQFIVGVDGRVISLQVDPSSGAGNLELIKAAMDAVRQWQYRPGTQNGIPVEFPTTITVDFKLVD
jgi:TonB family protein